MAATPKVAIAVFVKDEVHDFGSWIAWYLAIGADTIIVNDDHSTDGTWEVALAASRCADVRCVRTDRSVQPFTARQARTYLDTIRTFRDEFDWIGFVDADELLFLREDVDLPHFLGRFDEAAGIAFSWCIYGSNLQLLKPSLTMVESFTRHSLPSFGHNGSVKSFVRPERVVETWRDPHTFDLGGHPYVNPRGEPVPWGGPGGIAGEPDWSVAKLMHLIPRSMEHFVERIRRRTDLQSVTNEYWGVFDRNDVEDREPLRHLPALYDRLFLIGRELVGNWMDDARARLAPREFVLPWPDHDPPSSWSVRTAFGTLLALSADNTLIHAAAERIGSDGISPVRLLCRRRQGAALLAATTASRPVRVPQDGRAASLLAYGLEPSGRTGSFGLVRPHRQRCLSALPVDDETGLGDTAGDRFDVNEWERFELVSEGPVPAQLAAQAKQFYAAVAAPLDLFQAAGADDVSPELAAALLQFLSEADRGEIRRVVAAPLPHWI